jgi:hypothetical protein
MQHKTKLWQVPRFMLGSHDLAQYNLANTDRDLIRDSPFVGTKGRFNVNIDPQIVQSIRASRVSKRSQKSGRDREKKNQLKNDVIHESMALRPKKLQKKIVHL